MADAPVMPAEVRVLARDRGAVIFAHNYQRAEVQAVADVVGDSLELARRAATVAAQVIVLRGRALHGRDRGDPRARQDGAPAARRCRLPDGRHDHRAPARRVEGRASRCAGRDVRELLGRSQGAHRRVLHLGQRRRGRPLARRAEGAVRAGPQPRGVDRRAAARGGDAPVGRLLSGARRACRSRWCSRRRPRIRGRR